MGGVEAKFGFNIRCVSCSGCEEGECLQTEAHVRAPSRPRIFLNGHGGGGEQRWMDQLRKKEEEEKVKLKEKKEKLEL